MLFYPTDLGPLATDENASEYSDEASRYKYGLSLVIPDDPQIASQIKARFVLDSEEDRS